jgi:hypothetical protein
VSLVTAPGCAKEANAPSAGAKVIACSSTEAIRQFEKKNGSRSEVIDGRRGRCSCRERISVLKEAEAFAEVVMRGETVLRSMPEY